MGDVLYGMRLVENNEVFAYSLGIPVTLFWSEKPNVPRPTTVKDTGTSLINPKSHAVYGAFRCEI